MLVIISLLSAICHEGLGAPLQPPSTSSSDTSDPSGDIRFVTNYRSTPGIIWTCFATTLLCTWVSIHPNIVGYGSTKEGRRNARIKWFLLACFAPELTLVYAALQWKLANDIAHHFGKHHPRNLTALWRGMRRIAIFLGGESTALFLFGPDPKEKRKLRWKPEHGHFLLMGGVIFRIDGQLEYLDLKTLLKKNNEPNDKFARARTALDTTLPSKTTTMEIRDRSKGDAITKGLTFLQTSWFIVQIIARRAQNLDVTALEIVTLAYAVTTLLAYIFWWNKPLHVQNPIVIRLPGSSVDCTATEPKETEQPPDNEPEFIPYQLSRSCIMQLAWFTPIERAEALPSMGIPLYFNAIIVYLVLALLGVPGSFYYIAWNFTFPRLPIGRILWRVACVVNTALPVLATLVALAIPVLALVGVVVFGLGYLLRGFWRALKGSSQDGSVDSKPQGKSNSPQLKEDSQDGVEDLKPQRESNSAQLKEDSQDEVENLKHEGESNSKDSKAQLKKSEFGNLGKKALLLVVSFFYYSSRLILVALALWDLHDLPSDAHQTVSWSRFIPHF